MRISDWSSDVCSSDLQLAQLLADLVGQFAGGAQHQRLGADGFGVNRLQHAQAERGGLAAAGGRLRDHVAAFEDRGQCLRLDRGQFRVAQGFKAGRQGGGRSEEHTSELQSLMRISYAVFCLKKKKKHNTYIPM